jgi:hypothetical protein
VDTRVRIITSSANPHHDKQSRPHQPERVPANCGSQVPEPDDFAELDALIEDLTLDAYRDDEQLSGL